MKSRITIEVDFENNNSPVIQILKSDSDDVRDRLVSYFTEQLGGSSWCQIKWCQPEAAPEGFQRIFISPIKPDDFKEQSKVMLEQFNINEGYKKLANKR